jgi:formate hydrogenlyase transcriptional activator
MSLADRLRSFEQETNWLRTEPGRHGFALACVLAAAVMRYGLGVYLGFRGYYTLFYPAILMVALLAGFWPAVFATLVAAVAGAYLFVAPGHTWATVHVEGVVAPLLFILIGIAISALVEAMRRNESRLEEFERLVEGLDDMVVVVDREYRYLIANEAFLKYRGATKAEVLGRRATEVLTDGIFETVVKEKLDECFTGKVVQYELRYIYPVLGERELLITYLPIRGRNGMVDRVASVLQDVTEHKRAERALQESEERLRLAQKAARIGTFDANQVTGEVQWSPEMFELYGLRPDEFAGTSEGFLRMVHPEDLEWVEGLIARGNQTGEAEGEWRVIRPDGSVCWIASRWKVYRNEQGGPQRAIGIDMDITARKAAEKALRDSEERERAHAQELEAILDTLPIPVAIAHDAKKSLITTNRAGWEHYKLPPGTNLAPWAEPKQSFRFLREGVEIPDAQMPMSLAMALGRPIRNVPLTLVLEDGTERHELSSAAPLLDQEGRVRGAVGAAVDISDVVRAEDALRASEERLRLSQEVAHIGTFDRNLVTGEGRWTAEMEALYGLEAGEFPRTIEEFIGLVYAEDRKQVSELLERAMQEGGAQGEWRVVWPDGTMRWIAGCWRVLKDEAGNPMREIGVDYDITERKLAEGALRRSEGRFRLLVEQASDGIFLADGQGRYIDVNTAGAEMLGYDREEILGLSIADVVADEEIPRIRSEVGRFADGSIVTSDWKFRRKDGSFFSGEVVGRQLPDGRLQGIVRDVTERKQAEEILRQSEERFRVALKDSPIMVFNQDRDLRYTWIYNPQICWQESALGKTDEEILGQRKAAHLTEMKRRVMRERKSVRAEVAISHNGKSYAFEKTIEPLFDANGDVAGITGACMDIARLHELAEQLQDARDRLVQEKSYLESEIQSELGFEEIIGQSGVLRDVLKKARVVAPTSSSVLLLGETGTGKELVARSLHKLSPRCNKNFVKLNCAAVPSGLLESELFGHEKGAFTGAVSQKVGRIELADKGTLFLDEIGEMPLELQPKLLRVLQDREFERLGGVRTLKVDVRIISATNRDLWQDVSDRAFREDLFYRLNVFPISLPPLRERREDIAMLVHHFVRKHATRIGKQIVTIPDETMRALRDWSWPGNVRELENMIERMVILSKGSVLAAPPVELNDQELAADDDLTAMEREHIIRILRETNGVLSGNDGAANRLGLKRTTLQSMLKRFNIQLDQFRRNSSGAYGAL